MANYPAWIRKKLWGLTKLDREIILKNFENENRSPKEIIELIRSFRRTKSFNRHPAGLFRMRG